MPIFRRFCKGISFLNCILKPTTSAHTDLQHLHEFDAPPPPRALHLAPALRDERGAVAPRKTIPRPQRAHPTPIAPAPIFSPRAATLRFRRETPRRAKARLRGRCHCPRRADGGCERGLATSPPSVALFSLTIGSIASRPCTDPSWHSSPGLGSVEVRCKTRGRSEPRVKGAWPLVRSIPSTSARERPAAAAPCRAPARLPERIGQR